MLNHFAIQAVLLVLSAQIYSVSTFPSHNADFSEGHLIGRVDDPEVNEASGLAASRRHSNILYTINDSGGKARVYAISALNGTLVARLDISGGENCDWEDVAVGPGPIPYQSYIYIGDIGGNTDRSCRTVYRIAEPLHIVDDDLSIDGKVTYTWEEMNCETLMVSPSGDVILISKVQSDQVPKMFTIPQAAFDLGQVITLTQGSPVNMFSESEYPVAGDISPTGEEILIKSYNDIFYWQHPSSNSLSSTLQTEPTVLPYAIEPQGEAICWAYSGRAQTPPGYYTLSEGQGAALYYYVRISAAVPKVFKTNMFRPYNRPYFPHRKHYSQW